MSSHKILTPFVRNDKPAAPAGLKRVSVACPSGDMCHTDFAMSLAGMMYRPGALVSLGNPKGSLIIKNRNNAVAFARKMGDEYLLFIDSDVSFPADALRSLLAHDKDIVGATYSRRVPPYTVMGQTLEDKPLVASTGIHEVAGLPTGMLLIRLSVFDKLAKPYFLTPPFRDDKGELVLDDEGEPMIESEDYYFCRHARDAGFQIWLDIDLSMRCAHIGQAHYRIQNEVTDEGRAAADAEVAELNRRESAVQH